jgi:predicted AlkP superfamily pyrophosphatase or phosphodiesterase
VNKTIWAFAAACVGLSVSWASAELIPTPKVLIIGIDGCRPDALQAANTPNLDALIAVGTVSYTAVNEKPNGISGANWSSMLTGVHMDKHNVTGNSVDANGFLNNRFDLWPHFFSYLKAADPTVYTASYSDWSPLNSGMRVSLYANAVGTGSQSETAALVANQLRNGAPDAVFVQLDSVDGAGHSSGFLPTNPAYLAAIAKTDTDIGTILSALYSWPGYISGAEDWLVLCATDHGGKGTSHVQPSGGADVWTTFLIAAGPSVDTGFNIGSPENVDIAVTALDHMGINTSTLGLDGRVLRLADVPEPSTLVGLIGLAVVGLAFRSLRRVGKNDGR